MGASRQKRGMTDILFNFSDGGAIDALNEMYRSADRLDKKFDQLQANFNKGFTPPNGGAKQFNDALASTAKSAAEADKSIAKFGSSAGFSFAKFNLLAGVVQSAASGVAGFAGNVVNLGANLESVETNFAVFLKSTDKAKDLIAELNKFAADTPFSQNQIFGQSEKLLGFGFAANEITDTLQRLGDISGGSADKLDGLVLALSQVKAKGTLQGEEFLRFAERGLSTEIFAKSLGVTEDKVKKLVSDGKVSFADLQKAIKLATDEGGRFSGVLAAQSKTFTGLLSTLTGNFEQLQGEIGKLLLPVLKEVVIAANDIISGINVEGIGETFEKAAFRVKPFLNTLASGFNENILPALIRFRDTVQDAFDKLSSFFDGVNKNGEAANFLKSILNGVTVAFETLIDAVSFSIDAITDFAQPILNALAPALSTLYRVFSGVIDALSKIAPESGAAGSAFSDLAKPVAFLASVLSTVVEVAGEVVAGILNLGDSARNATPWIRGIGEVAEFVTIPLRKILGVLGDLIGKIAEFTGLSETEAEKQLRIQQEFLKKQAEAEDAFRGRERPKDTPKTDTELAAIKAANAASQAEREKAAKEREKLEKERSKLRLDLIQDETEKARALERERYKEQQADIKRLTPNGQERFDQEFVALANHKANLEKIEKDAADKDIEEKQKTLERERKFKDERDKIKGDISNAAFEGQQVLYEKEQQLLDSAQALYLEKLKLRGVKEVDIQKEAERLSLLTQASRLEREKKLKERQLLNLKEGDEQLAKQLVADIATLNNDIATINIKFKINADKDKLDLKDFFGDFKGSLAQALKIDPNTFNGLLSDAKSGFASFFDSIRSLSDLQIEQNNRVIASLNKRIEATQKALDKERKAQEEGQANSADSQQKALDALVAKREATEKKNQEIQAKATRFQILQDTASQVSGIATSIVNIIKGTSAIPFVGIALAAVQVAALFALLASARSQARAATKLHTGGRIKFGKTDEDGQEGYHIEDTGIQVGGGEWVINRRTSQKKNTFLKKVNEGKYDNVDIESVADALVSIRKQSRSHDTSETESVKEAKTANRERTFTENVRDFFTKTYLGTKTTKSDRRTGARETETNGFERTKNENKRLETIENVKMAIIRNERLYQRLNAERYQDISFSDFANSFTRGHVEEGEAMYHKRTSSNTYRVFTVEDFLRDVEETRAENVRRSTLKSLTTKNRANVFTVNERGERVASKLSKIYENIVETVKNDIERHFDNVTVEDFLKRLDKKKTSLTTVRESENMEILTNRKARHVANAHVESARSDHDVSSIGESRTKSVFHQKAEAFLQKTNETARRTIDLDRETHERVLDVLETTSEAKTSKRDKSALNETTRRNIEVTRLLNDLLTEAATTEERREFVKSIVSTKNEKLFDLLNTVGRNNADVQNTVSEIVRSADITELETLNKIRVFQENRENRGNRNFFERDVSHLVRELLSRNEFREVEYQNLDKSKFVAMTILEKMVNSKRETLEIEDVLTENRKTEFQNRAFAMFVDQKSTILRSDSIRQALNGMSGGSMPDYSEMVAAEAARISQAAKTINVHNTYNTSQTNIHNNQTHGAKVDMRPVVEAIKEQTNRIVRDGMYPLMQLGQRVVNPDGSITHYTIDSRGNTRKTTIK